MEVILFAEIQSEFMERIQNAIYCSMATVDFKGRPRSRIMHPIWDGPIGWVISRRGSHKATPPPLGFDPQPHYGTIHHPYFGLLRLTPWRIELGDLQSEPIIWRDQKVS
jgi:hypothetical protein